MTFLDKNKKALELIKEYTAKYPRHGLALSYGKDSIVLLHLVRQSTLR